MILPLFSGLIKQPGAFAAGPPLQLKPRPPLGAAPKLPPLCTAAARQTNLTNQTNCYAATTGMAGVLPKVANQTYSCM